MTSAQGESTDDRLILIGLGANLPSRFGTPEQTLGSALEALRQRGIGVIRQSRWWRSRPVPVSDQPWYVNGVAALRTELPPAELLAVLHDVEADFGRVRSVPNAARLLDLDLLAYGRLVSSGTAPILPHPRMAGRAFVLLPLADIAPGWRDPAAGRALSAMIAELSIDQRAEVIQPC